MVGRETLQAGPDIPFLSEYPEWDNLVAADMMVSAAADVASQTNPHLEQLRTLSSMYALNALGSHLDPRDPEATPDDFYDYVEHGSEEAAHRAFTEGQPLETKLSLDSFRDLQELVALTLPTARSYRRMQYFMLISDSMKNPVLMTAIGLDPKGNHDAGLVRMFSEDCADIRMQYFPSFDDPNKFNDDDRETLGQFIRLMDFNIPGFGQSQLSLAQIKIFDERLPKDIKSQFLLHGMLDVMGAMGGKNHTSALAYTQPTHDMFMHIFRALTSTADELGLPPDTEMSPFVREQAYLSLRASYYGISPQNFTESMRPIVIDESHVGPEEKELAIRSILNQRRHELITQVKFANMLRFSSPEQFMQLREAWNEMPERQVEKIMYQLSFAGDFDFDYGPALVRQMLGNTKDTMKDGLRKLNYLMEKIQEASNRLAGIEIPLDQELALGQVYPIGPAIGVLLRDWALKSRSPGFNLDDYEIKFTITGGTLTPQLVERHYD